MFVHCSGSCVTRALLGVVCILVAAQGGRGLANGGEYTLHRFSKISSNALQENSDEGIGFEQQVGTFLKTHGLGDHVKEGLEKNMVGYEVFVLGKVKPSELSVTFDVNCIGTLETGRECQNVLINFTHSTESMGRVDNACRRHRLKISDCAAVHSAIRSRQQEWLREQQKVTIVPATFLFEMIHASEQLVGLLGCKAIVGGWETSDWGGLLRKSKFKECACSIAMKMYQMGTVSEPWNKYYEANHQFEFNPDAYDMNHIFILSNEVPLSSMYNLGGILYNVAEGRSSDVYPLTEFQTSCLTHATTFLEGVLQLRPLHQQSLAIVASVRRLLGDIDAASAHYINGAILQNQFPKRSLGEIVHLDDELITYAFPAANKDFNHTVSFKVLHDMQQIQHLVDIGTFEGSSWRPVVNEYSILHGEFLELERRHDDDLWHHTRIPVEYKKILETNGRILNIRHTPALWPSTNVLGDWDGDKLTQEYVKGAPECTYVDNFLSDQALQEMYKFATESTVFHDVKGYTKSRAYLGAGMEEGFAPGLLFQIVQELRKKIPHIIGTMKLTQAWAYKYIGLDHVDEGINVHADDAAVNINFWITPDEANLLPQEGGLDVFDKKAPSSWSFKEMNRDAKKIRRFLHEEKPVAKMIKIPYKQNRMVIFHSSLFHRTSKLKFKKGFLNSRINLTLLFGGSRSRPVKS